MFENKPNIQSAWQKAVYDSVGQKQVIKSKLHDAVIHVDFYKDKPEECLYNIKKDIARIAYYIPITKEEFDRFSKDLDICKNEGGNLTMIDVYQAYCNFKTESVAPQAGQHTIAYQEVTMFLNQAHSPEYAHTRNQQRPDVQLQMKMAALWERMEEPEILFLNKLKEGLTIVKNTENLSDAMKTITDEINKVSSLLGIDEEGINRFQQNFIEFSTDGNGLSDDELTRAFCSLIESTKAKKIDNEILTSSVDAASNQSPEIIKELAYTMQYIKNNDTFDNEHQSYKHAISYAEKTLEFDLNRN